MKFGLQIYVKNELYSKTFFRSFVVKLLLKDYWDASSGAPACSPYELYYRFDQSGLYTNFLETFNLSHKPKITFPPKSQILMDNLL